MKMKLFKNKYKNIISAYILQMFIKMENVYEINFEENPKEYRAFIKLIKNIEIFFDVIKCGEFWRILDTKNKNFLNWFHKKL